MQALLGLLLLFGAFIVLTTINPNLVNLNLPELTGIQAGGTTPQTGGTQPSGGTTRAGLSDSQARQGLAQNIGVKPGVSLEGIQQTTIDGINKLKADCTCNIIITSGTDGNHAGGALSHGNGYKVDLRPNGPLNAYIMNNSTYIGKRSDDGAHQYQAPNGTIYAKEFNHWDVLVKS